MTEKQLEQESLSWLSEAGYAHLYGSYIALGGSRQLPNLIFRAQFLVKSNHVADKLHRKSQFVCISD